MSKSYLYQSSQSKEQNIGQDGPEGPPEEQPVEEEGQKHQVHQEGAQDYIGVCEGGVIWEIGIEHGGPNESIVS